ncbi:MAG: hypothetical protein ACRDBY_08000, partial [Cetobacterium sp.]
SIFKVSANKLFDTFNKSFKNKINYSQEQGAVTVNLKNKEEVLHDVWIFIVESFSFADKDTKDNNYSSDEVLEITLENLNDSSSSYTNNELDNNENNELIEAMNKFNNSNNAPYADFGK